MSINEKYSYNSFKRQSFVNVDPAEFNDTEIIGSSFYQDAHHTDVFSSNISGVTFTNCNLDNCNMPVGATVNGGTNKHFALQNDGEYWIVDESGAPVSPRDTDRFDYCGLSQDPTDIPAEPIDTFPVTIVNDPALIQKQQIEALANDTECMASLVAAGVNPSSIRGGAISIGGTVIAPLPIKQPPKMGRL
jgi:hypothetical protein